MSYKPPTPPANLPTEIVNTLNESDPEQLRDVATYAEALTEHKEREARLKESANQEEAKERPDDLPDDVLPKRQSRSRKSTTMATTGSGETVQCASHHRPK